MVTKRQEVNQNIRILAGKFPESIVLVDLELSTFLNADILTEQTKKELWDDSIHFTAKGYDVIAQVSIAPLSNYGRSSLMPYNPS